MVKTHFPHILANYVFRERLPRGKLINSGNIHEIRVFTLRKGSSWVVRTRGAHPQELDS